MGGYFPPANLELSYSLIELRRNDEAIDSLLLVAQKDGARLPISYYHLGRLYEMRGDLKAGRGLLCARCPILSGREFAVSSEPEWSAREAWRFFRRARRHGRLHQKQRTAGPKAGMV